MLARAALRAVRSGSVSAVPSTFARGLAADLAPKLDSPAPGAKFEPFDPTKWMTEVPDQTVKSELSRIRAAEDEAVASITGSVPDIDWDSWKQEISYPGIVDEMKAVHDSIPVPDFSVERERLQKMVHDEFEPLLSAIKKAAEDSEANSKKYEGRLAEMTALHDGLADMPIDEYLEKYPTVKKSIEDDVANNKWFV